MRPKPAQAIALQQFSECKAVAFLHISWFFFRFKLNYQKLTFTSSLFTHKKILFVLSSIYVHDPDKICDSFIPNFITDEDFYLRFSCIKVQKPDFSSPFFN